MSSIKPFLIKRSCKWQNLPFVALSIVANFSGTRSFGATPAIPLKGQTPYQDQVGALEQKLLQRTFPVDPTEKRLQRLELLLFGTGQIGTNQERLEQLKKASIGNGVDQTSKARTGKGSETSSLSEIAAIEKQVLKRTSPKLSATTRLSQLETKVFGQASPSMPLSNRIERLEKTIGMAGHPDGGQPSSRISNQPFEMLPNGGFSYHFYGNSRDLNSGRLDPQVSEIFRQMEQQMRHMENGGDIWPDQDLDGMPNKSPYDGDGSKHFEYHFQFPNRSDRQSEKLIPGNPPRFSAPHAKPAPQAPAEVPPYGAPDTI
jgi:hypothetical protein